MSTNMGNLEKLGILVIVILVVVVGVVALTPKATVDERIYPDGRRLTETAGLPETLEPVQGAAAVAAVKDAKPVDAWPAGTNGGAPVVDPKPSAADVAAPTFRNVKIKSGDTLAMIAKRELGSAARFKEILDANPGLVATKLAAGKEIKIPVAGAPSIAVPPTSGATATSTPLPADAAVGVVRTYVVKSGDTLSSIASREMGSSKKWPQLAAANESVLHGSTTLSVGMKLSLPAEGAAVVASRNVAPAGLSETAQPGAGDREYVVKSGDSLWAIAKNEMGSDSLVGELRDANQGVLKGGDTLRVGMKLTIPAKK